MKMRLRSKPELLRSRGLWSFGAGLGVALLAALALGAFGASTKSHSPQAGRPVATASAARLQRHRLHVRRDGTGRAGSGRRVGAWAPTAAQFTASADAICRDYRGQVGSLSHETSLTAQEHIYKSMVGAARRAVSSLRALSTPPADASAFARFTTMTSRAVDAFTAAQRQSRSTQEATGVAVAQQNFSAFQQAGRNAHAANVLAIRLGFRVCGSPGSDWL